MSTLKYCGYCGFVTEQLPNAPVCECDRRPLRALEAEAVSRALIRNGYRMAVTARELGIGRMTLHRKINKYGLHATGSEGASAPVSEGTTKPGKTPDPSKADNYR